MRVPLVLGGNTERALRRAARLADGWFSSGNPTFDEAVRLRARSASCAPTSGRVRRCRSTSGWPGVTRGAGPLRRAGFEHVTVWANQLWPDDGDLDSKRDRFLDASAAVVAA